MILRYNSYIALLLKNFSFFYWKTGFFRIFLHCSRHFGYVWVTNCSDADYFI